MKIKCPECAGNLFLLDTEERDQLDDVVNVIGDYYLVEIICANCSYTKLICLGC